MTTKTNPTLADALLTLSAIESPAKTAGMYEARRPQLKTIEAITDFLKNDADRYDTYELRAILAEAVGVDALVDAFESVGTLHHFYNNLTPVNELRAELEGRLLRLLSSRFSPDVRDLAYHNADLASRYENKRAW